ncbi:MAG TPA: tetratricopeptide repeat protein [Steroidobacteraceae bacterium]|jgi:tetratricopeptide (TPR) repeat protein|nr:tetratricopeptide repeat protein [Steroidobacteraceae bacterium]
MSIRLRSRLVVLAVALAFAAAIPAEEKPKTIGDLKSKPVEVRKDAKMPASSSKAMENYRRFLELQRTDPQLRAEAMRRLGDLNLESGELERMESEVTAVDIQGAEAIKLYSTLLKAYPTYNRNDQVLYQLARAYETTGQPEQALATLDRIVKQYPQSPQLDEVQFRRGELLFSAKQYPQAESAYAYVIKRGTSSAFYEQSLYKHGWSLFKQSLNEESLPSFSGVLDQKLLGGPNGKVAKDPEKLRRADRELVDDTLRVMSITFSYLDGAQTLDNYLNKRGEPPYSYLLYSRLGDLYVEKQRYQDAATTYRAYVARNPNSDYAPNLAMQAIEAYNKGGFTQLVLDGKHEYVERYNFGTAFWEGRDRAKYPKVVSELKTNLKDVATYFHATAQKSKKTEDFQEAAKWYRDYLKSFPDDPDSAGTNYLLAETLFESKQFAEAATEYERTAYFYPKNDKSATAAYASLVSYKQEEERLTGAAKQEWHAKATDAGVKFAQAFPEHPDSAGVLTRAAEDIFAAKDLPRSIQVAEMVLARQPPVDQPKQRIAWTIVAQANYDLGQYEKAEPAYLKARELAGNDPKMREDLTERLAAAVYKQGEAKTKAGDNAGAVEDFLRVARVAPDSKIKSTAEYDAAAALINLKQWERAIGVLEDFRREYPKSELQADVGRKLAVAYTEAGRSGQAAAEFERIASDPHEDKKVQREALLQSADLYTKANNIPKANAMLEKFVATNPRPVADAVEARQRLAEYAERTGDTAKRDQWYREIVKADATAGNERTDRTKYLAAKAQLALAQPVRDAFRGVRLTAPLKKSLVGKRAALDKALAAYRQAAEYNVAEVTTAATYETAELYRTLAKDLLNSERPKSLKDEALEEYNALLEEQVFPFEEQAINIHELNVARAQEGVYDESVRKSYQALAELKPGRYGKTELVQDVVTVLK